MTAINPAYAKTPGGGSGGAQFPTGGTLGDVLVWIGPGPNDVDWIALTALYTQIGAVFDGADDELEADRFVDIPVPYDCTILQYEVLTDAVDSIIFELWKVNFAGFPPTSANDITGGANITISAAQKKIDSTLTGWSTGLLAGDILRFRTQLSAAIAKKATVALRVMKL